MGNRLVYLPVLREFRAVAATLALLVEDAYHLEAGLLEKDLHGVLGEPRGPGAHQLGERSGGFGIDLAGTTLEDPPRNVHRAVPQMDGDATGLRHFLNLTMRPHSSLRLVPNSERREIWDAVNTGPSLHTLASSMTQHPHTPAPHFMYLSRDS